MTPADIAVVLRRLDQQDEILGEIRLQAKITNGRVTALEREQIKRETRESVLAEVAVNTEQRLERTTDKWHWKVGTVIALVGVVSAVSATVAQLF